VLRSWGPLLSFNAGVPLIKPVLADRIECRVTSELVEHTTIIRSICTVCEQTGSKVELCFAGGCFVAPLEGTVTNERLKKKKKKIIKKIKRYRYLLLITFVVNWRRLSLPRTS